MGRFKVVKCQKCKPKDLIISDEFKRNCKDRMYVCSVCDTAGYITIEPKLPKPNTQQVLN